jgi:hypothetical protein
MKITSKSGRDITELSTVPAEQEVLFPSGTSLQFVKKTIVADETPVYEFREVASSQCGARVTIGPDVEIKIKINSASYGENQAATNRGNVTEEAGEYCNDEKTCDYSVSHNYIEDPAPGKNKSFSVNWSCMKGALTIGTYSVTIPSPATDSNFEFGCTPSGQKSLKVLYLNPEYVYADVVSVITNAGRNVTAVVREGLSTDKSSNLPVEIDSSYFEGTAPTSLTFSYRCVKKTGPILKTVVIKKAEDDSYVGELGCGI